MTFTSVHIKKFININKINVKNNNFFKFINNMLRLSIVNRYGKVLLFYIIAIIYKHISKFYRKNTLLRVIKTLCLKMVEEMNGHADLHQKSRFSF